MTQKNMLIKISITLILTICFTISLSSLFAQDNAGTTGNQSIVLINGTIIDGIGHDPVPDGIVIIEGDKIIAVGQKNSLVIPSGSRIIDVKGATLLPGIMNAHVHNAYFEKHAAIWASCGVTTVRDLSCGRNEVEKTVAFRNQVRTNPKLCRIISAGSMIVVPWGYMGYYGITVNSAYDVRTKVTKELDAGVDFVKITLQEPSFPQFANLSPKLASLIVAKVHERGVPVTAHVGTTKDLKIALDCRVDDIAHIVSDELTDELIQRMVKSNTYLEPTLTNWATSKGKERAIILSNLKRFADAGGQVALGAEHIPTAKHAGPFVGMPITEFLMMQEAGMTPMQIITASTLNSAKVCRLDKILGTLEAGKLADILVLNGNPLLDLQCFSNVKIVIHNGIIIQE
jgi:imidazolonepropionase-like amidohydrolase